MIGKAKLLAVTVALSLGAACQTSSDNPLAADTGLTGGASGDADTPQGGQAGGANGGGAGGEPEGGTPAGGAGGEPQPGGGEADAGPEPDMAVGPPGDRDDDGIPDDTDNCPSAANHNQEDPDEDGLGDVCDLCPNEPDPDQADVDMDGIGDACDPHVGLPGDRDDDGVPDGEDNCPDDANHGQDDADGDGAGNACDACPQDETTAEAPCPPSAVVEPDRVDFGTVLSGCGRSEQSVTVSGPADACLASAALEGQCAGVSVLPPGGGCPDLQQPRRVTVVYEPEAEGELACTLALTVRGERDRVIRVPLEGLGSGRHVVDRFEVAPPDAVDVLMVMDDSASMEPIQFAFQDLFDEFFVRAADQGTDWRLGVVTTDVETNAAGVLYGPGVIRGGPNAEDDWREAVSPGTNGSGTEQGLEATRLALLDARNPGFRRRDAHLAILVVSDEEDQSPGLMASYPQAWVAAVDDVAERVTAYGVIGVNAQGQAAACDTGVIRADAGARYAAAFNLVGGRGYSVCGDQARAMRTIGDRIFGTRRAFSLSALPDGAPAIRVDLAPEADFNYFPADNVLRLTAEDESLPAGAIVEVEYDAVCP